MIRTIPLKIQNEYITGDKGMIGAAGSHNDVILRMEFSGMWDGLTKMVQFRDALGEATIEVLLTADMLEADDTSVYLVPVPSGAKKYAGEMTLCIKGAAVSAQKETRATLAVYGRFAVAESKWSADAETEADVPATNAEQLQRQIENVLATIVDARKAATEAAKSEATATHAAETAAVILSGTQKAAQNASESAKAAEKSAQDASKKYTLASAAANDAATFSQRAASSATEAKASENAAADSAANAAASATSAGESASTASGKAANAANSASAAYSYAEDALTAASAAQASKRSAASSQNAAKLSENNAAASATAAAESIKHAPRISSSGKWELWDATKNAYVATEYTAVGKDGTRWWTYNGVFASLGEKIWVSYHDIPNASIGDFVLHTRNDAGVVYEITGRDASNYGEWLVEKRCVLKGADGTTPHIGANGNWYIGSTDTGKPSRGATGEKGNPGEPGAPGPPGPKGADGITPTIGTNGNWFLGTTDTSKPSRGATGAKGDPGEPGAKGDPGEPGVAGKDGITPTIGSNGNWYLGATDTGEPSRGATGEKGDPGTDYVLTSADKAEIAALVLAEIPNGDEVAYG